MACSPCLAPWWIAQMVNTDPERLGGIHVDVAKFWLSSHQSAAKAAPVTGPAQSSGRGRAASSSDDDMPFPISRSRRGSGGAGAAPRGGRKGRRDLWTSPSNAGDGGDPSGGAGGDAETGMGGSGGGGGGDVWTVEEDEFRLGIYVTLTATATTPGPEEQLRRPSMDDSMTRRRRRGSTPIAAPLGIGPMDVSVGDGALRWREMCCLGREGVALGVWVWG